MFCGKCGAKIPEGFEFCMKCGTKIDPTQVEVEESSESETLQDEDRNLSETEANSGRKGISKQKLMLVIIVGIITILVLIGIFTMRGGNSKDGVVVIVGECHNRLAK